MPRIHKVLIMQEGWCKSNWMILWPNLRAYIQRTTHLKKRCMAQFCSKQWCSGKRGLMPPYFPLASFSHTQSGLREPCWSHCRVPHVCPRNSDRQISPTPIVILLMKSSSSHHIPQHKWAQHHFLMSPYHMCDCKLTHLTSHILCNEHVNTQQSHCRSFNRKAFLCLKPQRAASSQNRQYWTRWTNGLFVHKVVS